MEALPRGPSWGGSASWLVKQQAAGEVAFPLGGTRVSSLLHLTLLIFVTLCGLGFLWLKL